jgi:hypothetical protein
MKKKPSYLFSFLIVLFISICFARPVLAHGDEPRLEVTPERLNPGAVLEVRGVSFEFEVEVTLTLVAPEFELPLGNVIADADGVFTQNIILPSDLKEGVYTLRATTEDHEILSAQFTVWGSAVTEAGDQRTDEDALLAPMPTIPISDSISATPLSSEQLAAVPSKSSWLLLIFAALIVFGVLIFIARKVKTKN